VSERPEFWTSDEWSTPLDEVSRLAAEFGPFDVDVCARAETAKAPRFFTKADDGLSQEWRGRVWLNPPYSDPAPWLRKAIRETAAGRADVVVALLPASTDTGWFHDLVKHRAEVRFRRGRIKFLGWMGTPIGSPKAGSMFAIYRGVAQETA
jgi:phage N-6-adenine-methyltransferase